MGIRFTDIVELATGLLSTHKILYSTGSLTRSLQFSTFADWTLGTYAGYTPAGTGGIAEPVTAALARTVHTAQYATAGNFDTAKALLTGTLAVPNLQVIGTLATTGAAEINGAFTVLHDTTRLGLTSADVSTKLLVRGITAAVRIGTDASGGAIAGVDVTGVGSYQPLSIHGSLVQITDSGVVVASFDSGATSLTGTLAVSGNVTLGDTAADSHIINGPLRLNDDSISGLDIARSGGGDRIVIGGSTAGNGALLVVFNSGSTDYEPLDIAAENVEILTRTGALTFATVAQFGNAATSLTGTLAVSGNVTLGDAVGDSHTINGLFTAIGTQETVTGVVRSAAGDALRFVPRAAGSGFTLDITNNAQTDYEPFNLRGEYVAVSARTGVATAAEITRTTSTGFGIFCTPGTELDLIRSKDNANVAPRFSNSSVTGAAGTQLIIGVQNASTGDPVIYFEIGPTTFAWGVGVDNSAADDFVICGGGNPGTNDYFKISTAGLVTIPVELRVAVAHLGFSGTQDVLSAQGQASASGPILTAQNSAFSAYRPLTINASTVVTQVAGVSTTTVSSGLFSTVGAIRSTGASSSFNVHRRDTDATVFQIYSQTGSFHIYDSVSGFDAFTITPVASAARGFVFTLATAAGNPAFGTTAGSLLLTNTIVIMSSTAPTLQVGSSNVSTGDCNVDVGTGRTGNGYAYLDLIGDTTYTDYGVRLIRNNGGANTSSNLIHRGTGELSFHTQEAATIAFYALQLKAFQIEPVASAISYFTVLPAAAGGEPTLRVAGSPTDIHVGFASKGAGVHRFFTNTSVEQFRVQHAATAVNFLTVFGAATGSYPALSSANSGDANAGIIITTAGTGYIALRTGNIDQVRVTSTASADRYITLTGSNGGNPTIGTSAGNLQFGGNVRLNNTNQLILADTGNLDGVIIDTSGNNLRIRQVNAATIEIHTAGAKQAEFTSVASATRYLTFAGSNGGNATISVSAGSLAITPAVVFGADISIPAASNLYLDGGSNTYIEESSADVIQIVTGGASRVEISSNGLGIIDAGGDHYLQIKAGTNLTAQRTLTLTTGDADRTITLSGNPTLADWFDQSVKIAATPTFAGLSISANTGFKIRDTGNDHYLSIVPGSNLTADRTLTIVTGDANRTLTLNGDATIGSGFVLGTEVATTSGTSIDVTGIPSGVKKITIMFVGVSTSGTSRPIIQIGDSGGIETSTYVSSSSSMSSAVGTASSGIGFVIRSEAAANALHGAITLTLEDSTDNVWVCTGALKIAANDETIIVAGSKSGLTTALDRVRLTTTNGTDTFDAGVINILYES